MEKEFSEVVKRLRYDVFKKWVKYFFLVIVCFKREYEVFD